MAKSSAPHENLTVSRYTDLVQEPVARFLSPIKGYETTPLVSLEQSVTYISHLFDGIEENVWVAKENSKTPPDGLTQDESAAIHLYTMQFDTEPSFYKLLNGTLRGENRDDLKPWFAYLKLFLTALYKLPSHPQTIWRGVRDVDLSTKYPTGSKFAWWGVSSCTNNVEVLQAETFLGRTGLRTLFSIESQNGKSIAPHSYFKDTEKETVLMPGTYFEVIGQLNPADGLYIIQLKELDPPIAFVKPPFKKELTTPNVTTAPTNITTPVTNPATEPQQTPNVSSNESVNLKQTAVVTETPPIPPPPPPPPKPLKVRVLSSNMSPRMQAYAIDVVQKAIAEEGDDEEECKLTITDAITTKFGGRWFINVGPKSSGPLHVMPNRTQLQINVDKYSISMFQ